MKIATLPTILYLAASFAASASAAGPAHWVVAWGASPAPQLPDEAQMRTAKLMFDNQTIREIVHTSIASDTVRVRLSNAYGKQAVEIGAVHIALHDKGSSIAAGSDHTVTFGGRPGVSIAPNGEALSDPVKLAAPAGDLVISIFVPHAAAGAGIHYSAQQTAYIGPGDLTGAVELSEPATVTSWVFLTGVDALAAEGASTLVAFGDSITDGARSTVDANHRWPDVLAERLRARRGAKPIGVLDAGIGGNRVLFDPMNVRFGVNALARFDRDVLAQPGVKYVIVLEGINDLGHPGSSAPLSETVSAEDIIAGLKQMIERAHEHGLKIFGATLTPFEGTTIQGYFSAEKEAKRKAVNEWIRTGNAFDGVIDFDKAARDPQHPDRMLPANDGGDHLHPGDAGYKAMAEAIDLSLFK
jgi:lysophospholipase L1-like esterase